MDVADRLFPLLDTHFSVGGHRVLIPAWCGGDPATQASLVLYALDVVNQAKFELAHDWGWLVANNEPYWSMDLLTLMLTSELEV